MSTPLKQHKDSEAKLHEHLYRNVLLLTHIYPTSKEFDMVFKRDMFMKSNKSAFHQVIYYLLDILNPQLTKQKITAWPLYDFKLESKFRSEVLSYINELNGIYPNANIPNIMASHLITPGGYKFVKFMFILSQFVLFQHLEKNNIELVPRIKPNKDPKVTGIVIKNLKEKTAAVESSTRQLYEKFNRCYEGASEKASSIVFEQTQLNKDMDELNKVLEEMKNALQNESFSTEALLQQLDGFKGKMADLETVRNLCKIGNELLMCVSGEDGLLDYNKETVVVPKKISHLTDENDKLDLHQLLRGLIAVLENESLNVPGFTNSQLDNMIKMVEELNEKYCRFDRRLKANKIKLMETLDREIVHPESKHQQQIPTIKITLFKGDETLAKPLEDSGAERNGQ